MDSGNAQQQYAQAQQLFASGAHVEALGALDDLLRRFPNEKSLLYARARCLVELGRFEDARAACTDLIERFGHDRSRELLATIDARAEATMPSEFAIPDLGLDIGPSMPPPMPRQASKSGGVLRVVTIVAVLGVIGVTGYIVFDRVRANLAAASRSAGASSTNNTSTGAFTDDYIAQERRKRENSRREQLEELTARPGQEIPKSLWFPTVNGLPEFHPGIYRDVPTLSAPERTLDIYIPTAYRERPNDSFPGVVMSSPGRGHGFWELERWAERQEVILVWLNSSYNGTYDNIYQAQDTGLETVIAGLRVDQTMGFAIGSSGGGAASWALACRYPDGFRGIVLIGIGSAHYDCSFPRYVRVAYINGNRDFNVPGIEQTKRQLLSQGYQVQHAVFPGGHELGPLHLREQALDWMVNEERRARGLPLPGAR